MAELPDFIDNPAAIYPGSPEVRRHINREHRRKRIKALRRMCDNLEVEPDRFDLNTTEGQLACWAAIREVLAGGEMVSPGNRTPVIGDPFGVALECVCTDDHGGRGWHRQTLIVKTEHRQADQAEGERILEFLRHQDNARFCLGQLEDGSECRKEIGTYSTHVGRVSEMAVRDGYAMYLAERT